DHDAGAEEMRERNLVDERRALHHVRRRVDVRGIVHACGDALGEHAGFGVIMDALDANVLEIGPVRRLITKAVGQVVKLKPHAVVEVLLECDATDFLCHRNLSHCRWTMSATCLALRSFDRVEIALRYKKRWRGTTRGAHHGDKDCGRRALS